MTMGLFGNLFKGGKELNEAANAVSNAVVLLDQYERDPDFVNFLCVAAWITQVGFLDRVDANKWYPNYTIFAQINGQMLRMTIAEATQRTMGRIMIKASQLSQREQNIINEIFEKGAAFYELQNSLPQQVIDMFKR